MRINQDPVKLIALKLSTLNWLDRKWLLSKLPKDQRLAIKIGLKQLKKLNIQNKKDLFLQLLSRIEEVPQDDTLKEYLSEALDTENKKMANKAKHLLRHHLVRETQISSNNVS